MGAFVRRALCRSPQPAGQKCEAPDALAPLPKWTLPAVRRASDRRIRVARVALNIVAARRVRPSRGHCGGRCTDEKCQCQKDFLRGHDSISLRVQCRRVLKRFRPEKYLSEIGIWSCFGRSARGSIFRRSLYKSSNMSLHLKFVELNSLPVWRRGRLLAV
jgi:hypothetical protein